MVSLIRFADLRARWGETRPGVVEAASWVGGPGVPNHSPGIAVESPLIGVNLLRIPPAADAAVETLPGGLTLVVLSGAAAVLAPDGGREAVATAGALDAVHVPSGAAHVIRNTGPEPLLVMQVLDKPR
ncbi:MAG: Cupin domain [Enterovirga sp.]|nr:Cupin domain [Enterovirga sp.]